MIAQSDYIKMSLELNLFFLRIMKEHIIFVAASLPPKNNALMQQGLQLEQQFNSLLGEAIAMANGVISPEVIRSGELVTPFTLKAEMVTQNLTGIPIDTRLTQAEAVLTPGTGIGVNPVLVQNVSVLNDNAINLVATLIGVKQRILDEVSACRMFTFLYPTLLEHVIQEAKMYLRMLQKLQRGEGFDGLREIGGQEVFWDHIMGDHATFIRGLLDPSEEALIDKANDFAKEFRELTRRAQVAMERLMALQRVTEESFDATRRIRDFKAQGTQGALECKIKSIIIPLLNDHVLREASYYLRLLTLFQRELRG